MANKPQKAIVKLGEEKTKEIHDALQEHGEVKVVNIGKLSVRTIQPRPRYNFAEQTTTHFPKSKTVVFRPSQALKRSI